jgi:ParB-like chromosome segregation protein Spo0J
MVPIEMLKEGDSPRRAGADEEHVRLLLELPADLPPLAVQRSTMRVIDGMHRLRVARLRGDRAVQVRYVTGSDDEVFVLAVEANVAHGLPLTLDDRRAAATRIVHAFPHWSDREIARRAGLSPATVARLRAEVGADGGPRLGRDGRLRGPSVAEGRLRAQDVLAQRPDLTVRELALAAGISVGTAHDVRERVRRGEDAVPDGVRRSSRHPSPPADRAGTADADAQPPPQPELRSRLQGLMRDPAVRYSEPGRELLRWLARHMVQVADITSLTERVPPHCLPAVADLARGYGEVWLGLAAQIERAEQSST